jgi:hypothetical protein
MIRFSKFAALAFFALCAFTSAFAAQPRIAVLDIFTDENSIRAQSAATNFTALLQAELTRDFELVERAQLAAAERELHLSAMNRGSAASGLRIGKWAKADFLLSGALTTEGENRQLELTLINTANADAVAKTNIILGLKSAAPLREFGPQVLKVSPAVSNFLKLAIEANAVREKQISVSFLYLQPQTIGLTDEESRKFGNWPQLAEQKLATNPAVRVVRFPEARAEVAESSLMLSGLVESDPEAFTHVADYYVWATANHVGAYVEQGGRRRFSSMARYAITIWDGRTEPKSIIVTNLPNSSGLPTVADAAIAEIRSKPQGAPLAGIREKISTAWTTAALQLMDHKYFSADNLDHRIAFNRILRLLDLAAFVNPLDALPQEQSLFLRFNGLSDFEQSHRFRKDWAASEAFGAHLDRFGSGTLRPFPSMRGKVTVAASALHWPAQLLETIHDHVGSDRGYGAPLDASNELRREWRLFWMREMTQRAAKTAIKAAEVADALPWFSMPGGGYNRPDREELQARLELLEALKPAVAELALVNAGFAQGYARNYSDLRKQLGLPDAPLIVTQSGLRRARLPRFDELPPIARSRVFRQTNAPSPAASAEVPREVPKTNEVLAWPSLATAIEEMRGELIAWPDSQPGKQIAVLVKSAGELYVGVEQGVESEVEGEARDLRQAFGAATRRAIELFRVEGSQLVPAFPGQQLNAHAITPAGDNFMFITSNRLARVLNGQLEFSPPVSISEPPQITAAHGDDFFYLTRFRSDRTPELVQLNFRSGAATNCALAKIAQTTYGEGELMAVNASQLWLSRGPAELFDRAQSTWTVTDLIPRNDNAHLPISQRINYTVASEIASDTTGGFWICSDRALAYTNSARGISRRWSREPAPQVYSQQSIVQQVVNDIEGTRRAGPTSTPREHTHLSGRPIGVATDGKFAWVALTDGPAILVDPETERFAQRINIGPYGASLAFADNALWIASYRSPLFKRSAKAAASIRADEWLPIRYTREQTSAALANLRPTERAALLLVDGEREQARAILAPKVTNSVANTQAIHLLLMALTFDPAHGETKKRAEYLTPLTTLNDDIGAVAKAELARLFEQPTAMAKTPTNSMRFGPMYGGPATNYPGGPLSSRRFTNNIQTNRR